MKKFEEVKHLFRSISDEYGDDEAIYKRMYVSGLTSDSNWLFELCWKTMKEYLKNHLGIIEAKTRSPKIILQLAYKENIVDDEIWLDMLEDRNDDVHEYDEAIAWAYVSRIKRDYLPVIDQFIETMKERLPDEPEDYREIPKEFIEEFKKSGIKYFDEYLRIKMNEKNVDNINELF